MRNKLDLALLLASAAMLVSACARPGTAAQVMQSESALTTITATSPLLPSSDEATSLQSDPVLVASTDAWKAKGLTLIQDAKDHPSVNMVYQVPFAVLSNPIDVTQVGTYSLVFSMPASYDASPPPEGVAGGFGLTFPDDTMSMFTLSPGASTFTELGGQLILTKQMRVTSLIRPYPKFSVWVSGGG